MTRAASMTRRVAGFRSTRGRRTLYAHGSDTTTSRGGHLVESRLFIRLAPHHKKRLARLAKKRGTCVSAVVRELIITALMAA